MSQNLGATGRDLVGRGPTPRSIAWVRGPIHQTPKLRVRYSSRQGHAWVPTTRADGDTPGCLAEMRQRCRSKWRRSSPRQVAAVDGVVGASGEGRTVAGQPGDQFGHLFGLAEPLQGVLGAEEVQGGLVEVLAEQGSDDEARPNGVDSYPVSGVFPRCCLGEAHYSVFGSRVALAVAKPTWPKIDAMLMIDPPPVAFIARMAARWV